MQLKMRKDWKCENLKNSCCGVIVGIFLSGNRCQRGGNRKIWLSGMFSLPSNAMKFQLVLSRLVLPKRISSILFSDMKIWEMKETICSQGDLIQNKTSIILKNLSLPMTYCASSRESKHLDNPQNQRMHLKARSSDDGFPEILRFVKLTQNVGD
ncbi:hypothetical protein HNY73_006329 [Argiope bruennichi]|uniref:Uncharacterized protein n=1 Tax=Argiope bruennichi TaxID=94029 RepID=A0A8T0FRX7_ARGBR|nr:hypothetical protein HNY73_006329 [Argiope bruennichi]